MMKKSRIGFEMPVYIFILVFAICLAHTILTEYPPEEKIHYDTGIDDTIIYEKIELNNTDTEMKPISVVRYNQ